MFRPPLAAQVLRTSIWFRWRMSTGTVATTGSTFGTCCTLQRQPSGTMWCSTQQTLPAWQKQDPCLATSCTREVFQALGVTPVRDRVSTCQMLETVDHGDWEIRRQWEFASGSASKCAMTAVCALVMNGVRMTVWQCGGFWAGGGSGRGIQSAGGHERCWHVTALLQRVLVRPWSIF